MCYKKKYVQNHLHNTLQKSLISVRESSLSSTLPSLFFMTKEKQVKVTGTFRFSWWKPYLLCLTWLPHFCYGSVRQRNEMVLLDENQRNRQISRFFVCFRIYSNSTKIIRFDYPRIIRLIWTNSCWNNK